MICVKMKLLVNPQLENLTPSTRLNPHLSSENFQPPPRTQVLKMGQPSPTRVGWGGNYANPLDVRGDYPFTTPDLDVV